MFALQPRRSIQEVALAVGVGFLPLIIGTPQRLAYGVFAVLFFLRFALQPPTGEPPTLRRRVLLIALAWSAFAALAWAWISLFQRPV